MFLKQCQGSISVLMAFVFGLLFLVAGGAVDYTNSLRIKVDLQLILDAATLSVAKVSLNGTDREALFRQSVDAQLRSEGMNPQLVTSTLTATETATSVEVTGTLSTTSDNLMLGGFGINLGQISVSATANHTVTSLEIALVLDVSSSMEENGRLDALKAATTTFLDDVMFYENGSQKSNVAVSIIPYGGSVRLPKELYTKVSLDISGQPEFKFNAWDGCLIYDDQDYHDGLLSFFDSGKTRFDVNPTGDYEPLPRYWAYEKHNWWCPKAGNQIVPLTTSYNTLLNTVYNFDYSDGTGTHIGVMWAWKMLSPVWRGQLSDMEPNLPADYDRPTVTKVMVVMTDGGISEHIMPTANSLKEYRSSYRAYSEGSGRRVYTTQPEATTYFNSLCAGAKADGIIIYGVGYDLVENGEPAHNLLNCASSSRHYFSPSTIEPSTNELSSAFQAISTQLHPPRLVN